MKIEVLCDMHLQQGTNEVWIRVLWLLAVFYLAALPLAQPAKAQDLMGIANCDPGACSRDEVSAVETAYVAPGITRGLLIRSLTAKGLIVPQGWLTPKTETRKVSRGVYVHSVWFDYWANGARRTAIWTVREKDGDEIAQGAQNQTACLLDAFPIEGSKTKLAAICTLLPDTTDRELFKRREANGLAALRELFAKERDQQDDLEDPGPPPGSDLQKLEDQYKREPKQK